MVNIMYLFRDPVLLELVPRIWPFLSHNISNVRKASLMMLNTVFSEVSLGVRLIFWESLP